MRVSETITDKSGHILVYLKVQPGASETALVKIHDNRIVIRIQAAPEKGKANKAIIEFLSKKLSVPRNDISIIHGLGSSFKTVQLPDSAKSRLITVLEKIR
ncbi:MAG: DUF167 domain-containing protein [Spirochaetales bacterium]|nr:DUF167 domain-containing protein [Spirochaetales bacterium]